MKFTAMKLSCYPTIGTELTETFDTFNIRIANTHTTRYTSLALQFPSSKK